MQSLDDDERKEVFDEVLADELKTIRQYVERMPILEEKTDNIDTKVDKINFQPTIVEHIVKAHDDDIRMLKRKVA